MLTFRHAVVSDQAAIANVGTRAWCSYVCNLHQIKPAQRERAELAFLHFAQALYDQVVIAECDSQIVGWGARDTGLNYISDLWVDPPYQRQGIGRSILDVMLAQITLQGFKFALISTHQQNIAAMQLYLKCGFTIQEHYNEWSASLEKDVVKVRLALDLSHQR